MWRLKLFRRRYFRQLLIYIIIVSCFLAFLFSNSTSLYQEPEIPKSAPARREPASADYVAPVVPSTSTEPNLGKQRHLSPVGQLPWFFQNGTYCPQPTRGRKSPIWPDESSEDRIVEQLMYRPAIEHGVASGPERTSIILAQEENSVLVEERSKHEHQKSKRTGDKLVLLYNQHGWPGVKLGSGMFDKCPVRSCSVTKSKHDMRIADAVLFKDFVPAVAKPHPDQIWILYLLESPMHTQGFLNVHSINWTATYRRDSDIVTPYAKWVYYDPEVTSLPVSRNHAANKTKLVAWFVSNCHARNNRLQFVRELAKHVGVDIYGACGNYKCPRNNAKMCFDLLNARYKFYLAFENSNCVDYITEKFFVNGLTNDVVPIVMGARPQDYARAAPKKSYIHVDDFASPQDLAEYLKYLDSHDAAYNEYFTWKGTGEFINTYFFCRMCAMLHDPEPPSKEYLNLSKWWRLDAMCRRGSWNTTLEQKTSEQHKAELANKEKRGTDSDKWPVLL